MPKKYDTGGYVVVHPYKRSQMVVIPHMQKPLMGPVKVCPTCQVKHSFKTYHILLNGEGRAVVSPGVFKSLKQVGFGGELAVEAHTTEPPNQVIGTKGGKAGIIPQRERMVFHN